MARPYTSVSELAALPVTNYKGGTFTGTSWRQGPLSFVLWVDSKHCTPDLQLVRSQDGRQLTLRGTATGWNAAWVECREARDMSPVVAEYMEQQIEVLRDLVLIHLRQHAPQLFEGATP